MKNIKSLIQKLISCTMVTFILFSPIAVSAFTPDAKIDSISSNSLKSGQEIIQRILVILTTIAVIGFVLLIVVGGIQYLGSFGNEEATTKSRKLILDAVIGLFIVLAAFGITSFVLGQLGVTFTGFNVQR